MLMSTRLYSTMFVLIIIFGDNTGNFDQPLQQLLGCMRLYSIQFIGLISGMVAFMQPWAVALLQLVGYSGLLILGVRGVLHYIAIDYKLQN